MSKKTDQEAPYEHAGIWQTRYDENSTRWERGTLNPAFVHWQSKGYFDGLGSVIVPGCGRSPEPLAFAHLGTQVTALDFASTATDYQTKQFSDQSMTAHIEAADVLRWNPTASVDAVYDQTCLCALNPLVWPDYADQIHDWLKPGGRAFMLFMQTGTDGGPPFHCPLETMHELFYDTRWNWPDEAFFRTDHSSGKFELGAVLTRC